MLKPPLIIILLFLLSASCAKYKIHQQPEANQKEFHVDLYTQSGHDQLEYAKQFAGEGDYITALNLFRGIYENEELSPETRAEALLHLGSIRANILFPGKNYTRALYAFNKLIAEFPESDFRPEAQKAIENINRLMKHN